MATRKHTKRPDLAAILGRFSEAVALITVTHRALDLLEIASDEETALRIGLAMLRSAYNELDAAAGAL